MVCLHLQAKNKSLLHNQTTPNPVSKSKKKKRNRLWYLYLPRFGYVWCQTPWPSLHKYIVLCCDNGSVDSSGTTWTCRAIRWSPWFANYSSIMKTFGRSKNYFYLQTVGIGKWKILLFPICTMAYSGTTSPFIPWRWIGAGSSGIGISTRIGTYHIQKHWRPPRPFFYGNFCSYFTTSSVAEWTFRKIFYLQIFVGISVLETKMPTQGYVVPKQFVAFWAKV